LVGSKNVDDYGKIVKEKLTQAYRWSCSPFWYCCLKDFEQALRYGKNDA
jgi:hypothetical protein